MVFWEIMGQKRDCEYKTSLTSLFKNDPQVLLAADHSQLFLGKPKKDIGYPINLRALCLSDTKIICMKILKIRQVLTLLVLSFCILQPARSQSGVDSTGLPGDDFSLQGALQLFKDAASIEDFEKSLNHSLHQIQRSIRS